jgi:hypothetical protein
MMIMMMMKDAVVGTGYGDDDYASDGCDDYASVTSNFLILKILFMIKR